MDENDDNTVWNVRRGNKYEERNKNGGYKDDDPNGTVKNPRTKEQKINDYLEIYFPDVDVITDHNDQYVYKEKPLFDYKFKNEFKKPKFELESTEGKDDFGSIKKKMIPFLRTHCQKVTENLENIEISFELLKD